MKQNNYFCDHCTIEKFDSETQTYINQSFCCDTTAHWRQHIDTKKHILNTIICKNLEEDLIVECKHCKVVYTKEQYKQHSQRNSVLWAMKDKYKESSCNHFTCDGKRFADLPTLRDYMEHSTKYKRQKYERNKIFEAAAEIIENKTKWEKELHEARQRNAEKQRAKFAAKKAKQDAKEASKKLQKLTKRKSEKTTAEILADEVVSLENNDNIKLTIKPIIDDLYGEDWVETPVEKKKRERADINIPPIIDEDDICEDCGYTGNFHIEYPEEKLERYGHSLCCCGEDED
tara:strand:- start:304 stop:1167 length:864 start_codon:yes stop_codon:yes gene_type:complete